MYILSILDCIMVASLWAFVHVKALSDFLKKGPRLKASLTPSLDYILSSAWVEDTMMCDYGGQSLREYNACARLESSRLSRERGFVPEAGSSPEFDESCLFKACGFR